ncbi:MAG: hypothetical protein HRK26_00115 [Rickettsiaceae bacterium H1]|nr:hypothetical protein [Rickettsiaceae bacterium H1]
MFCKLRYFVILTFVLLFFSSGCFSGTCIPPFSFDCKCDDDDKTGCDFLYNTAKDINDPKDWRAFFYPKIRVRSSGGCRISQNTSKTLDVGSCGYVCPRKAAAFKAKCDPVSGTTEGIRNDNGSMDCICASVATTCSDTIWNDIFGKTVFGCFVIPMGPPPAPCCSNIVKPNRPNLTIVPVREASVINPRIKVRVGVDVKRKCSNGDEVEIAQSCVNGITDSILSYAESELKPGESTQLQYNNKDYNFSAYLDENNICARYDVSDPSLILEQCYGLIKMPDPTIKSYSADSVSLAVDGYDNNQEFQIRYGEQHNGTGLYLIKPTINERREFKYVDEKFEENPNSNMLCVHGSNPINDYSITRNDRLIRFRRVNDVFIPVKYSSIVGGFIEDDSVGRNNVNIIDTGQNVLDTVILDNDGISIRPDMNNREKFRYQNPLIQVGNETTPYITLENDPILLSDQETENMKQTNAYIRGLCFPKPTYVDITNTTQDQFRTIDFVTNKCDFVTIEAWGAGASGWRENYTGSAGGYTKGTINFKKTDSKKTLKIKVGEGSGNNNSGEDTVVWLCEDDKSNCQQLLTAKGGPLNGLASEGDVDNSKLFEVERLKGNSGIHINPNRDEPMVPLPLKLPDPPPVGDDGNPISYPPIETGNYVKFEDTNCNGGNEISYRKKEKPNIPGAGGCISLADWTYQDGAKGLVRLTCEQWEK